MRDDGHKDGKEPAAAPPHRRESGTEAWNPPARRSTGSCRNTRRNAKRKGQDHELAMHVMGAQGGARTHGHGQTRAHRPGRPLPARRTQRMAHRGHPDGRGAHERIKRQTCPEGARGDGMHPPGQPEARPMGRARQLRARPVPVRRLGMLHERDPRARVRETRTTGQGGTRRTARKRRRDGRSKRHRSQGCQNDTPGKRRKQAKTQRCQNDTPGR